MVYNIMNDLSVLVEKSKIITYQQEMEDLADRCKYYEILSIAPIIRSCLNCVYIDSQIYTCKKLGKPVIEYRWE